ncbi:hypothetical protein Cyrtocomes_01000 [Candidatus Cyrtobacter comes]|uniref:Uncharacterized protein n=1 Tax=Candidatus Cyrtobacter comes TaxID=675776 RepID=A0ABU5L9U5_9RICK|nr:hypothetical protein [Candidatus Cyrtobacter comes]MDZ5762609.1 hypothetical protein [Candidatus Cyrtobacter comes]
MSTYTKTTNSSITPQTAQTREIDKFINKHGKLIDTHEIQTLSKDEQFAHLVQSQQMDSEFKAVYNGYDYLINKFYTDLKDFHDRSSLLFQGGKQTFHVTFNHNVIYGHVSKDGSSGQAYLSCSHGDSIYNIMHIFFQYLALKNGNFVFESDPGLFFSIGKKSYKPFTEQNISKYFKISAYVGGVSKQLNFYETNAEGKKIANKEAFNALDEYMKSIEKILIKDIQDEGSMCETLVESEAYITGLLCMRHNNVVVNANTPMNLKNCNSIMEYIKLDPEICDYADSIHTDL